MAPPGPGAQRAQAPDTRRSDARLARDRCRSRTVDSPRGQRALAYSFRVPLSKPHISGKFQKPHRSLRRPSPLSAPRRPPPSRSHRLSSERCLAAAQGRSRASQDPPPSACFQRAPREMSHAAPELTGLSPLHGPGVSPVLGTPAGPILLQAAPLRLPRGLGSSPAGPSEAASLDLPPTPVFACLVLPPFPRLRRLLCPSHTFQIFLGVSRRKDCPGPHVLLNAATFYLFLIFYLYLSFVCILFLLYFGPQYALAAA